MKKKFLLQIQGVVWLLVGAMLLNLGAHFLLEIKPEGNEMFLIGCIIGAVILGQIKGRTVLTKVGERNFQRIASLSCTTIKDLYTRKDLFIIGGMMLLGMGMKYFGLPVALRGSIDIAVGTALIQGSLRHFHHSLSHKLESSINN